MDTKTLLILAGVGGVAYYLYTEGEKKKPVELSQKSKDMAVAKAASQAAIAAGTYKGSARMQRLKAQRAAAQAKKTATFTPPTAPAPAPEEIQAGNEAMAAQQEQQLEESIVLLTEAVGRGDLRAAMEVSQTIGSQMGAPERTYEEWLAEAAKAADDPQAAAMLAHVCAQTQDPKQTYCRLLTLMSQVAPMAKAEVAKTNPIHARRNFSTGLGGILVPLFLVFGVGLFLLKKKT